MKSISIKKKNNIQISWKYNDIIFILIFRLVLAINNNKLESNT